MFFVLLLCLFSLSISLQARTCFSSVPYTPHSVLQFMWSLQSHIKFISTYNLIQTSCATTQPESRIWNLLIPCCHCHRIIHSESISAHHSQTVLTITYAREVTRYLWRLQGPWVSEECIFSVLTNNWPSCAPVVCVFQSHEALYQSSHFLFHR